MQLKSVMRLIQIVMGETYDEDSINALRYYADVDEDGYGDSNNYVDSCFEVENHVLNDDDCDDYDSSSGEPLVWFTDYDEDGYGNGSPTELICTPPANFYVNNNDDCDDTDSTIYPNATEIRTDGIDQDCDGQDAVWEKVVGVDRSIDVCCTSTQPNGTYENSRYGYCLFDSLSRVLCKYHYVYLHNGIWYEGIFYDSNNSYSSASFNFLGDGNEFLCLLDQVGQAECLGNNNFGQSYPLNSTYSIIDVGERTTCALNTDEEIECWGDDSSNIITHAPVGTLLDFAIGGQSGCAVKENEEIICWGEPLGMPPPLGSGYLAIDVGSKIACALDSNGSITCWGEYNFQIDSSLGPFKEFDVGDMDNICALTINDEIYCSGTDVSNFPINTTAISVAVASSVGMAISPDGHVITW